MRASWQRELMDRARASVERMEGEPKPWWVFFDPPAPGLLARGEDSLAVARTLLGMRRGLQGGVPTANDPDCLWWPFTAPTERLAVKEEDMKAVMRCARLTGLHGHYRRASGEGERTYRF